MAKIAILYCKRIKDHSCIACAKCHKAMKEKNGEFAKEYVSLCSENYGRSLERMVSLSQKQMHGRIADALIYLSGEIYESNKIGADISRQDIADYTSMSKDSAIRILKEFERDKIIQLEGKTIQRKPKKYQ